MEAWTQRVEVLFNGNIIRCGVELIMDLCQGITFYKCSVKGKQTDIVIIQVIL